MVNLYKGDCYFCDEPVPKLQGERLKVRGKWEVAHPKCLHHKKVPLSQLLAPKEMEQYQKLMSPSY